MEAQVLLVLILQQHESRFNSPKPFIPVLSPKRRPSVYLLDRPLAYHAPPGLLLVDVNLKIRVVVIASRVLDNWLWLAIVVARDILRPRYVHVDDGRTASLVGIRDVG
jgi:hypothetical protein